jgi:hypothetical protein
MLQGTADGMRALEAREAATGDVAPTPEEPGDGAGGGSSVARLRRGNQRQLGGTAGLAGANQLLMITISSFSSSSQWPPALRVYLLEKDIMVHSEYIYYKK